MRFSGGARAYMAKIFLPSRSPPKIACDFRGGQEHIWLRFFCRAGPPRKSHAIFGGDKSIYGSVKKTCEKNPPGCDLRSVPRVFLSDRRSVKKSRKKRVFLRFLEKKNRKRFFFSAPAVENRLRFSTAGEGPFF